MRLLLGSLIIVAMAMQDDLYVARDLTAEGLFSTNIEGPAVDGEGRLFVVNAERDGTIGLVHMDGRVEVFVTLPAGSTANAIQIDSRGMLLLADFTGHNVLELDPRTRQVRVYAHDGRFNQPNDLAITRQDVIYASDPNWKAGTGQLWRIDPGGRVTLLESGMGTTNGIELSPDERTLYVNESVQRRVWAYDAATDGSLSRKRLFTSFEDHGLDGMKCDREGNLYITRYGKGVIAIVRPDGTLVREVPLKGRNVSNLVFGGPDGRSVFVTLQDRKGMEVFRSATPGRRFRSTL